MYGHAFQAVLSFTRWMRNRQDFILMFFLCLALYLSRYYATIGVIHTPLFSSLHASHQEWTPDVRSLFLLSLCYSLHMRGVSPVVRLLLVCEVADRPPRMIEYLPTVFSVLVLKTGHLGIYSAYPGKYPLQKCTRRTTCFPEIVIVRNSLSHRKRNNYQLNNFLRSIFHHFASAFNTHLPPESRSNQWGK